MSRKLSTDVNATADDIKIHVGEVLKLAKSIEDSSKRAASSTEQMVPQIEEINSAITSSSERTENMMVGIQHIKTQSTLMSTNMDALMAKFNPATTQILSNTELILRNLERMSLGHSRVETYTSTPTISVLDVCKNACIVVLFHRVVLNIC